MSGLQAGQKQAVATIAEGTVTAVGNRKAVITASAGGKTATVRVIVSQKTDKIALTLNEKPKKGAALKAKVGAFYQIKSMVEPENAEAANAAVKWPASSRAWSVTAK